MAKKITQLGTVTSLTLDEPTSSEGGKCCKKVERLNVSFNSEDMNKVVDKINEIIESKCH